MTERRLGIIMNGVTGRMGTHQHLVRSILAIRAHGGVALANGDRVMPDPILVGRDAGRVATLAADHGLERWTTDLDAALSNDSDNEPFDNGFKLQWEAYIRHLCEDGPFPWNLAEGARGVQLAEAGLASWTERRWIDLPEPEL